MEMDSRPSDAIALAVRFSAPIFVEEAIMEKSGIILPEGFRATPGRFGRRSAGGEAESPTLDSLKAKARSAIRKSGTKMPPAPRCDQ